MTNGGRTTARSGRAGGAPFLVASVAAALLLAACGGGGDDGGGRAGDAVGEERCEANRAAGTITYATSFQFAASSSILDVVAADEQGYYEDHCLDVVLQTGFSGGPNEQLVSAGTAQLAGVGGPGDVLVAASRGAGIKGVATYGNAGVVTVLVADDGPVREPKDLEGKTFGFKGAPPPQYVAMLEREGVDRARITEIEVSFDPSVLATGGVDALAAYKSNEPEALRRQGFATRQLDPEDYGVESSFNTIIANADFARDHPTAVEDFLRATFLGYAYADANLDAALGFAAERSEGDYDVEAERARWEVETALIEENLAPGRAVGWQDEEQYRKEADLLAGTSALGGAVDVAAVLDNSYLEAIYDGATLKEAD